MVTVTEHELIHGRENMGGEVRMAPLVNQERSFVQSSFFTVCTAFTIILINTFIDLDFQKSVFLDEE